MHLSNSTAAPALLLVNPDSGADGSGIGVLGAKATFRFDSRGIVGLDTQTAFGLHVDSKKHVLGILPADRINRRGNQFEVMLLGHAYAGHAVRLLRSAPASAEVVEDSH